jgi:hypothetical protein
LIENPFESGQIKNYLLLYASVVVIMVLFFMATTLFSETKSVDKKIFESATEEKSSKEIPKTNIEQEEKLSPFKLLEKAY